VERVNYIARAEGRFTVTGAPEGYDAWLAAEAALRTKGLVLFVAPDDLRAACASDAVRFFAPGASVLSFPAWDCLPYDRVSPKPDIESTRLATLAALARRTKDSGPALVITTVNAILQRVPPREAILGASFAARVGDAVSHEKLALFLAHNGYVRSGTVRT
jgi:transcription-repair coupling factor (superfamily II helicase)